MIDSWTFGQRIAAGFAGVVGFALLIGLVAVLALQSVVSAKDAVIDGASATLVAAQTLRTTYEQRSAAVRGYVLTKNPRLLGETTEAQGLFDETLARIATDGSDVSRIRDADLGYRAALNDVIELTKSGVPTEQVGAAIDRDVLPARDTLGAAITALVTDQRAILATARDAATYRAQLATALLIGLSFAALAIASAAAVILGRSLGRQIGTAVGQVQSSSAELQSAANQQATASRQQSTAMTEIGTTISELLATSRQIADSSERVVDIAEQTGTAARAGEEVVDRTQDSIEAIRVQVDLVVEHMLELGRKSQQIGGVLDIVAELADQTNILAINATIEAAGAGDAGRRFGVVADEIRKLADRVGGSTKEIRVLIDDVRTAVNTTVMATESGSKAVDAGSRSFRDVTSALRHIAALVSTTTEAAREIQLSTQQQATAVEQVNLAIANVAQATRETEASAGQTLATAGELTSVSRSLVRLIRATDR